jgi:ABC-type lipoprotein release transport system permease subunit
MRSVLCGVAPTEPVTVATITGGLLLMSFVSAYVPARRAARIDPVVSLRSE